MAIDPEIKRELEDLKRGNSTRVSSVSLAVAPATTTTVSRRGVSSTDLILTQASSALASNSDITRIIPAKDSFVITHAASANARTFTYIVITNAAG